MRTTKRRGTVLCEDRRTERFVRAWLEATGHDVRAFRFDTAPSGRAQGAAWVLARYPDEVRFLRSRKHQGGLCLIAVRDGDAAGVAKRKRELDAALEAVGEMPRAATEAVATPVPTWAIETWLLALAGHRVDERRADETGTEWKLVFERGLRDDERAHLRRAARAFATDGPTAGLPSLLDGHEELGRI